MEVQARLNRLESELRWTRAILVAMALATVGTLVLGAAAPPPSDLEVRSLKVMDEAGRPRIVLGSNPNGTVLLLLDEARRERVSLGLTPAGTGMLIKSSDGRRSAGMGQFPSDEGSSVLLQGGGAGGILLTATEDRSSVRVEGPRSAELWQAERGEGGPMAGLTLWNQESPEGGLSTGFGSPEVWLRGANGDWRQSAP